MKMLTLADMAPRLGGTFRVSAGDGVYGFELIAAEKITDTGREGGAFRLEFRGPVDPALPQAIYAFEGDAFSDDIFIVPVARDAQGTHYEAIFT